MYYVFDVVEQRDYSTLLRQDRLGSHFRRIRPLEHDDSARVHCMLRGVEGNVRQDTETPPQDVARTVGVGQDEHLRAGRRLRAALQGLARGLRVSDPLRANERG